jgi:hypothetical protein
MVQPRSKSAQNAGASSSGPKLLSIRSELFEHAIFPVMANKLTSNVLITTFTNLNLLSSIDYKIKMQHWIDQSRRHMPGMTEQDATIYFLAYKTMLEEVDAQNFTSAVTVNKDAPLSELQVDVRCFAIFIAMQLYTQQARDNETSKIEQQDSWGFQNAQSSSHHLSSPRQKTTSKLTATGMSKFSIMMHFIKNNLKLFLRLVSTDIHNTEVSLTANEFNSLRILFKPQQI